MVASQENGSPVVGLLPQEPLDRLCVCWHFLLHWRNSYPAVTRSSEPRQLKQGMPLEGEVDDWVGEAVWF
jgi:hypothetical protein